MKISITINRVEAQWAFGGGRLLVAGEGIAFRVPDTEQARRTYVVGRVVDIEIQPRKR